MKSLQSELLGSESHQRKAMMCLINAKISASTLGNKRFVSGMDFDCCIISLGVQSCVIKDQETAALKRSRWQLASLPSCTWLILESDSSARQVRTALFAQKHTENIWKPGSNPAISATKTRQVREGRREGGREACFVNSRGKRATWCSARKLLLFYYLRLCRVPAKLPLWIHSLYVYRHTDIPPLLWEYSRFDSGHMNGIFRLDFPNDALFSWI